MKKENIQTPAILVDLDALENNLKTYQKMCSDNNKEMWPMLKTHKSSELMKMQVELGAKGVLCGTLDEAECAAEMGVQNIMYAYPVASKESIDRIIALTKKANFIVRLDSYEAGVLINERAKEANVVIQYSIIVDSGLHRFGVAGEKVLGLANKLKDLQNMKLMAISTHPGQVYGMSDKQGAIKCAEEEKTAMKNAKNLLERNGFALKYVTSGSTPTFQYAVSDESINIMHPGNYLFFDTVQLSTETAKESDCSLTIFSTVIANPQDGLFLIDAGAKCLGLDQGAHGNSSIVGFGKVKNHPEIIVQGLSEEVGKLKITGDTNLKIGDKIEIIPNHACSSANLTDNLIGVRNGVLERVFKVDIRGNKKTNAI